MNNSSRYFKNEACQYYPCHKGIEDLNCLFCYCPLYLWKKCPGNNYYIENDGRKIKVCSNCNFPHNPNNYDRIIELLKMGEEKFSKAAQANLHENALSEKGTLFGMGVGPGDANLVTKQVEKLMEQIDVLIFPGASKESCRAYSIIQKAIEDIDEKECIFVPFPMNMVESQLSAFHKNIAKIIEEHLDNNKNVGFLTIGDVSIYSTFNYIEVLVKEDGYNTVYINGIPSFCAVAARLGIPLAIGDTKVHIIPGKADIQEALELDGTLVFMKSGKTLMKLKNILMEKELTDNIDVRAVSNCGMENEIISIGANNITDEGGYLTVVIVRKQYN